MELPRSLIVGKVAIIKSHLLPKILHVFSVLTTPEEFIKQLLSMFEPNVIRLLTPNNCVVFCN